MKKVSMKEAIDIATKISYRAEQERREAAELEAALAKKQDPKEIWILMAFNGALLKSWQTGKVFEKTNYTKPGFFFDEQEAVEAVLENAQDLCEARMNKYAVVYPVAEGIDMHCMEFDRIHWFEYVPETDRYKKINSLSLGCTILGFE